MTIIERTGRLITKMNVTFSMGNNLPYTVFKFFAQQNRYRLNESQKTGFRDTFPHISGSIGPIVSKNNRVHAWVDPHQPCEFHKNRFKTATTCIV